MKNYEILVDTNKCTGCLQCQLACSELDTGVFNPAAAKIKVVVSGRDCSINFTDDCNQCGTCADRCFYGALQKKKKEAA